jgi:glutathione synthase
LTQTLQEKGLDYVGIDVINGYLIEINVTSPTGIVPILQETGFDLANLWLKQIDARLKNR